jgi:hypothetical protein
MFEFTRKKIDKEKDVYLGIILSPIKSQLHRQKPNVGKSATWEARARQRVKT